MAIDVEKTRLSLHKKKKGLSQISQILNSLGKNYQKAEIWDEALKIYEELLDIIDKNEFEKNHPARAGVFFNFAKINKNMGNKKKSKENCEKCLEMRKQKLGEDHPHTKETMNLLKDIEKMP